MIRYDVEKKLSINLIRIKITLILFTVNIKVFVQNSTFKIRFFLIYCTAHVPINDPYEQLQIHMSTV